MPDLKTNKLTFRQKLGIALLAISSFAYLFILIIPFLSFAVETKVWLTTTLVLAGEFGFWVGAVLAGSAVIKEIKNKIFKKKKTSKTEIEEEEIEENSSKD